MDQPTRSCRWGYLALCWALGLVLLLAAALKGWDAARGPAGGATLFLQVAAESLLGIWLLSGFCRPLAWGAAVLGFALFAGVAGWQVVRGASSCGCFGWVAVPPLYTALFDLAALVLLVWLRRVPRAEVSVGNRWSLGLAVVAAGAIALGIGAMRPRLVPLGDSGDLPATDGIIYLQPEDWVGKPCPLLPHTSLGAALGQGRWIAVIYNSSCGHCRPAVPEYEQLAITWQDRANAPRVALIEIPPCAPPERNRAKGYGPALVGHLSPQRKWFAATPAIFALQDGRVLAVAEDDDTAEAWATRVFGAGR